MARPTIGSILEDEHGIRSFERVHVVSGGGTMHVRCWPVGVYLVRGVVASGDIDWDAGKGVDWRSWWFWWWLWGFLFFRDTR